MRWRGKNSKRDSLWSHLSEADAKAKLYPQIPPPPLTPPTKGGETRVRSQSREDDKDES